MLSCPPPPPAAPRPPPRRPCAASCSSPPTLPAPRRGCAATASPCAGWKGARASARGLRLEHLSPPQAGQYALPMENSAASSFGKRLIAWVVLIVGALIALKLVLGVLIGLASAARDDRAGRRRRDGGALGAAPHLMPYIVLCLSFGLAGGFVGRIKGSSFFLWFMISAILPFIGLIAAIALPLRPRRAAAPVPRLREDRQAPRRALHPLRHRARVPRGRDSPGIGRRAPIDSTSSLQAVPGGKRG